MRNGDRDLPFLGAAKSTNHFIIIIAFGGIERNTDGAEINERAASKSETLKHSARISNRAG